MACPPVRRRVSAGPPTGAGPRINEQEIRQQPSSAAAVASSSSSSLQNLHQRIGSSSRVPATTSANPQGTVPGPGGGGAPPPPAIGDRSSSSSSSSPKFLHNPRVWALGGPCVGVLLLLGGRPTSLGVAFGVMACYCFDLADNAEGALVSVWGAVLWSAGTLLWAGSTLGLVHKANVLACVLLVGVWATLQFRTTIYRDDPDVARLLERLLFACFPLPAAAILTWAGVAFGGVTYAAPCVALFMYAAVGLYAVPLRSGLGGGGAGGVHGDSRAPCLLCACMLLLPALLQISIDYRLLVWAGGAVRRESLQKVALAASLPWPMLLSLRSKGVLWWARPGLRRRLDKILSVGGAVSLLVLCETSKSLVLLPVFRPFLFSAPRPPLDSILASAVLACLAAAWFVQGRAGQRGVYAARALTVASVRCLGLLLGVDQAVMPLFDLSAFALSMLVFSGRRDLKAYVVGVAGVSSFILWFSWQTVWHLSFSFALPLGPSHWEGEGSSSPSPSSSLSLQQVSACCAALSFGVLLVPGMVAFGVRQVALGVVFGLHAVVLMLLEIVLVGAEARDPWQLDGLYPLPLVALTGVLGVWMAFRLVRDHGVDPLFLWIPGSIGAAKMLACFLAVLVPTDAESPEMSYLFTVIPIVSLAMAATAPFALFRRMPPTQTAVETRLGSGPPPVGEGIAEDWSGPMVPLEGGLCVFFMASALYVCSRPVISPLLRQLLSGGGHIGNADASVDSPPHSLAFCGVILALYALAVVSRHFPDSRPARRSGAALLVASMALLVFQPSALSGVVEGDYGGGGRSWRTWREYVEQACGVAVAGVGVLTLTGLASPTKTLARRTAFAIGVGVPVGVWSALASMPGADAAIVSWSGLGAAGTYSCALMVLLEAALPRPAAAAVLSRRGSGSRTGGGGGGAAGRARRTGGVLVELYVAVVAFMPAAGIAQGLQLLILGPVGRNLMGFPPPSTVHNGDGDGGGGTNAQGAARFALATAATGHAVIAVALKLLEERTGGAGGSGGGGGGGGGRGAGAGFGRRRGVHGPASVSRAFGEARWIPSMGNASAIFSAVGAFFCCWRHLPGESSRALSAIPCCALLLLLQEDGRLFRGDTGFGAAVPAGALSATWAGSAAYYVLLKGSSLAGSPRSSFSLLSLLGAGGLLRPALGVYRGVLHHFHGAYGAAESRRHGEAAVALRAVSFWTADSPWQPLWNLALLAVSVPSHAFLARFLWGGRGSTPQRASEVLAALAINALPLIAADLASINLMGLTGLAGGLTQLWLLRDRQVTGRRII